MAQTDKSRKSSARPASRDISPPAAAVKGQKSGKREAETGNRRGDKETRRQGDGEIKRNLSLPSPSLSTPDVPSPTTNVQLLASDPVTAPRAPRDIPGLGPIRVRALEKAGLGSLRALRAASLEQLLAVRGMSEIKARYIQSYLSNAPLPPDGVEEADSAPDTRTRLNVPSGSTSGSPSDAAEAEDRLPAPERRAEWEQEAENARVAVIALLISPLAPDFRARLLRELVRFAAGVPAWVVGLAQGGEKDQDRAARRLRRLQEALAEARLDLDRKTQSRLAEDMAEASDRLYALSGQTEPVRKAEDVHE